SLVRTRGWLSPSKVDPSTFIAFLHQLFAVVLERAFPAVDGHLSFPVLQPAQEPPAPPPDDQDAIMPWPYHTRPYHPPDQVVSPCHSTLALPCASLTCLDSNPYHTRLRCHPV